MKSLPHLFAGLFGLATAALLVVVWRQHQEIASLETAVSLAARFGMGGRGP